jgi:hypothetical protein
VALEHIANVGPRIWNVIRLGAVEGKPVTEIARDVATVYGQAVTQVPAVARSPLGEAQMPVESLGQWAGGKFSKGWQQFVVSMVVDTLTDPVTYLTGGAGAVANGAGRCGGGCRPGQQNSHAALP